MSSKYHVPLVGTEYVPYVELMQYESCMTNSRPVQNRVIINVDAYKILQVVPQCGEHLGKKLLMKLNFASSHPL